MDGHQRCGWDSVCCRQRRRRLWRRRQRRKRWRGQTGWHGPRRWHHCQRQRCWERRRSSSAGSNKGGEAVNDVWELEGEGAVNCSSEAVQDREERRSLPSPSSPHSSSTSLRRPRWCRWHHFWSWCGGAFAGWGGSGWGCGSHGGREVRTCVYSGGGSATPSTATTTAVAFLSSGGGRGSCWQAACDGDDLETSGVANHHSIL